MVFRELTAKGLQLREHRWIVALLTHARSPEDLERPVKVDKQLKFLAFEGPKDYSLGSFSPSVLLSFSIVRDGVQHDFQLVCDLVAVVDVGVAAVDNANRRIVQSDGSRSLNILGRS